jgi:hypothetical protein
MADDDPISFVLAGKVEFWDPDARVLYVGRTRLEVAPGVAVETLVPKQFVTGTGHRSKHNSGAWVVTGLRSCLPTPDITPELS